MIKLIRHNTTSHSTWDPSVIDTAGEFNQEHWEIYKKQILNLLSNWLLKWVSNTHNAVGATIIIIKVIELIYSSFCQQWGFCMCILYICIYFIFYNFTAHTKNWRPSWSKLKTQVSWRRRSVLCTSYLHTGVRALISANKTKTNGQDVGARGHLVPESQCVPVRT